MSGGRPSAVIMVGLTLVAMSVGAQLNDAATAASSLPEMATSTTSMAIAPTTSVTAATSATAMTTPYGFSADHQGRRLVAATYRSPTYVCETVVFPGGGPPLPIETPTVDIQDLISSAGRRGVDQSNFFEIYDWSAVVDESQWITALGTPNRTDRPDFYPGTHGRVEFALFEDRWITMWSGWCTATASNLELPARDLLGGIALARRLPGAAHPSTGRRRTRG